MSGDGGKDIKASGLKEIAQGITLTLGELKELGMDSLAGAGRGFSDLQLSGLELGNDGLVSAFKSFCERWEWGVRALVNEGNSFAQAVHLSAGTLYETDQYVEGALKVGANSLMGNPYASEDDITKMSWGDLASNNALAHADYSQKSFEDAAHNSAQGWKDAARDVMTSHTLGPMGINPENLHRALGVSDQQYGQALDHALGPSPEERAKAAAEQQARQGGGAG
ncbi:hypothetical protein AAW14_33605 [Streptomyces hygroscopicus]|uniref:hypothetical protein n=1 Tax=Streptomyces hygroscopicus TaxID=1912 RepID=UPI0022404683|nr:hypothetical protein [Streptomyces hygroscopicus]MCW7946788.1 hypothetical protein [Streptomyces hygroscopicus]